MHALSLQSLLHRERLPAQLAREPLVLGGRLVQCPKVLGEDLLAGEAALALRTRAVLVTAKAICTRTRAQRHETQVKSRELPSFLLLLKSNYSCLVASDS